MEFSLGKAVAEPPHPKVLGERRLEDDAMLGGGV
jgi:hypothetical protein